jgi:hypothetical protein
VQVDLSGLYNDLVNTRREHFTSTHEGWTQEVIIVDQDKNAPWESVYDVRGVSYDPDSQRYVIMMEQR